MSIVTSRGIYLDQVKEPALSRDIIKYISSKSEEKIHDFEFEHEFTFDEIIKITRDANIIDDHDESKLYKKLINAKKNEIKEIVGDAVDDEPYISSQMTPLLKLSDEAVGGIKIISKMFDNAQTMFTVYQHIFDMEIKIPKELGGIPIKKVGSKYPVEGRSANVKGKDRIIIGTGALIFLYRAVKEAKKQTTTFITVAGNCIGNPHNIEVSIGTPIMQIIERCGLIGNPNRIVIGGAMSGINIIDPEKTTITATTKSILVIKDEVKDRFFSCIRCGRCETHCPQNLNPMYIYKAINKRRDNDAKRLGAMECISCGICSYICPSKLDITATIQTFKTKYKTEEGEIVQNET